MTKILSYVLLVLTLSIIEMVKCESENSFDDEMRTRRQLNALPLVYPVGGGTAKLIITLSTPLEVEIKGMSFSVGVQYQYSQFANISELSQYYVYKEVSRTERELDLEQRRDERILFYKSTAAMLDAKGMNGEECVLRAMCEAAQYPLAEEGLVGEIIHILLTPDYGRDPLEVQDPGWLESVSEYQDAATAGRQMFSCTDLYPGCPQGRGVLELFTMLRDE